MTIELKVPALPESVADATIATWHKKPGEAVTRDENVVDLETDKVVLEVPSPCDGVLQSISEDTGATVVSGDLLGTIEAGKVEGTPAPVQSSGSAPKEQSVTAEAALLSPAARRLVDENSIDAGQVSGSGRDGRITKGDVLDHLAAAQQKSAAPPEASAAIAGEPDPSGRVEERVPMSRLRSRIAQRLQESQESSVMLTSFNEIDMKAVIEIRQRYKEAFEKSHGVRLGFMSFFVKAVCEALKKYPIVNASMDGNDIIYHAYQDIGVAVAAPKGLVVPILRSAGDLNLARIEAQIREYADKARTGGLQLEDLQGGTFTITNGGVFGSLFSTPIINPPQSAILGMHAIKERAVVVDGEVVARPMMYVALTYDHQIIDGKDAVLFLVAIKEALEEPTRLLLEL